MGTFYSLRDELDSLRGYKNNPSKSSKSSKSSKPPEPLFAYVGAKNQLFPHIKKVLEFLGVKKIAEPFAGSAVVSRNFDAEKIFLAEINDDIRAALEAIRDGDPYLLWRQVMMEQVPPEYQTELYPQHGKGAKALSEKIFKDPFGRHVHSTDALLERRAKGLIEANKKLRGAVIYKSAWDLMEKYKDDHEVTWFLDPPYPDACHQGYGKDDGCWTMKDHERLMRMISVLKGAVVLTGYENMRPPSSLRMNEESVVVERKIAKKENRWVSEFIWWRKKLPFFKKNTSDPRDAIRSGMEAIKSEKRKERKERPNAVVIENHRLIRRKGDLLLNLAAEWNAPASRSPLVSDAKKAMKVFYAILQGKRNTLSPKDTKFWSLLIADNAGDPPEKLAQSAIDILSATMLNWKELSNLRLDIPTLKQRMKESENGLWGAVNERLPSWVFLYHIERLSREKGRLIHHSFNLSSSEIAKQELRDALILFESNNPLPPDIESNG